MKDYGTLSEAINKLKEEGYSHDFNLLDEHLENKKDKERYTAKEFDVDKVLRFEGMSNPDDNSVLYAITTSNGKKGVLTDAYGVYSGQVSKEMIEKLKIHPEA
ncbi:phosphoribosylpyrophosphate synthetase [Mesonia aquimarina]|uniref:phosphoribosylpyrophosphate synthetase n=1 Tax=Mesonia aquimarina TaxID=1504967 RepID=UPI000EF57188|nr:phosphoribosylpyrophosphate synthetase [Mesonia aquimarina]